MDNIRILKCNRCMHKWATRMEGGPKYCPECKSPYWNRPRVRKWIYKYYDKKRVKVI